MSHISDFLAEGLRAVSLSRLGWAFLLAWVFCVFYTSALGGTGASSFTPSDAQGMLYSTCPVAASVVTLVAVVALERRFGSPIHCRGMFAAASIAASLSTPLLLANPADGALSAVLYILGAFATGFGSGLLWIMWGEYYARVSQEDAEFLAPASAFVAALIGLVVASMSGVVPIVAVSLLPAASGACLFFAWRDAENGQISSEFGKPGDELSASSNCAKPPLRSAFGVMARPCFGIFVACAIICVEGALFDGADAAENVQISFVASLVFMVLVGFTAISGPRRVSLAFLYRWMCPILVIGYACIIVLGPECGLFVAYMVAIAARFAFCLITQMHFARFAVRGLASPVQAYGLGWISVHLGDMVGVFIVAFARSGVAAGAFSLDQVSACAMAALVVSVMFVLNDGHSFRSQQSEGDQRASRVEERGADNAACDETLDIAQSAAIDPEAALDARIAQLAGEARLTPREVEVFGLLARGRSVPYIRDELVISRETAATHTKHIYSKLGVHSRQELIDLVR